MRLYRLRTIQASIRHRVLGGSVTDWLLNTVGPGRGFAARRAIDRIEEVGGFWMIFCHGHPSPLFVPREVPLHSVYQALYEQAFKWHWHQYQIPATTVQSDDIVFDCGCAEGVFTFLNQRHARQFVCFEPAPLFVRGLKKTFSETPNVTIVEAALDDRVGRSFFRDAGMASCLTDSPTGISVAVETIDNYCDRTDTKVSYLKADLEGFEMNVLRGAEKTIRRCRPRVAITTYHVPSHAEEIRLFLKTLVPDYKFMTKGVEPQAGAPVMLHAW